MQSDGRSHHSSVSDTVSLPIKQEISEAEVKEAILIIGRDDIVADDDDLPEGIPDPLHGSGFLDPLLLVRDHICALDIQAVAIPLRHEIDLKLRAATLP